MNLLPNGWVRATLQDVAAWSSGGTPSRASPEYYFGAIPWLKTGELGPRVLLNSEEHISEAALASSSAKVFPKGSVAIAMYGATIGKTSILGVDAATNQACAVGFPEAVSSEFLYYFLLSQETGFVDAGKGGAQPNISQSIIKAWPLLLPPRSEQSRIVAKLEELLSDLDAGVAELKAAQKKLERYRQSLLKAAVEGTLTSAWREAQRAAGAPVETGEQLLARILRDRRARWEEKQLAKFKEQGKPAPRDWQRKYPEPVAPDTTGLPELPEGWVWASVDQCSLDENSITDGPFGSNLKSEHYQDSGPRVIRLQNIGDGTFLNAVAHISESHFARLSKHAVETGDVVLAMLGEVLPRACAVPGGVTPAIVKADCARIRLNIEAMRLALVVAQLNSMPVRNAVMKLIKGIGRPRINLTHVRSIPIALAPHDEQVAIEGILQEAQLLIQYQLSAIALSREQSTAQRQNILRAAFSGQLVPQDPNDEPASVLLDRIRSERAAKERQGKPRSRKAGKAARVGKAT